ncbi:glycosyltransferase family 2 protein [Arsukibacterium sp.]|uniref:glycosyltransferase family 2 protein n=1 Tax=Arsukibacterium sp. TaxID=1977258 RepID=UPI001BD21204|nr:glycosyltransferase family 2 protein [Arsukibacterium sp.]
MSLNNSEILQVKPQIENASLQSPQLSPEQIWHGSELSRIVMPLPATSWLAITAQLELLDGQPGVQLEFSGAESSLVGLPMSLKGVINEVVAVPAGATGVALRPLTTDGRFILHAVTLQPLSELKRLWRMWRRVAMYFKQTTAAERARAAITPGLFKHGVSALYQRIGQLKASAPTLPYPEWLARFDTLTGASKQQLLRALKQWQTPTSLAVLIYPTASCSQADVQHSVQSVTALYQHNPVPAYVLREDNTAEIARQLASYQHALLLPAGVTLAQHALGWLLAPRFRGFAVCYSDHDVLDAGGQRCQPQFKPDWNPELCRSGHYIGGALRITVDKLLAAGWLDHATAEGSYGLLLRIEATLTAESTGHIPAVLYHQPQTTVLLPDARLLQQHFASLQLSAEVKQNRWGQLDIHYQPAAPLPQVSIIVPTRNMLAVLQPCIDSVIQRTDYPDFEVLIVDNQSDDPATLAYMQQMAQHPGVRILRYDAPFNYSAINNFAVEQARGEFICLLNNDTEVIRPDWLSQLVGQLQQPAVGAVGARLLFADNRVQHAGDAIGVGGCAGHMHFRLAAEEPGYMARAVVSQDLSAVTAACLLTPKALYLQLGGLNEQDLTVAFNDVDYCLKVREQGKRVIYTPLAELYHYESVSRGKDDNPVKQRRAAQEAEYMRQRWAGIMQGDPFYNPNLNSKTPDFRISPAPEVTKPWQS